MSNKKTEAAILDLLGDSVTELETIDDTPFVMDYQNPDEMSDYQATVQEFSRDIEQFATIAPERCRPWKFADRQEAEMGDLKSLEKSITLTGQQEPILVRPVINDESFDYEVIFGNRRWRACSNLNIPIKAIIKNLSDRDAAIAQKEENENREGISDFSKAFYYKKLIDNKVFKSEKVLAESMSISKQNLNILMSYTRLDKNLISAFKFPHKINKYMAKEMSLYCSKAEAGKLPKKYIGALISLAPKIESGSISYRKLSEALDSFFNKDGTTGEKNSKKLSFSKKQNGRLVIEIGKDVTEKCDPGLIEKCLKDFFAKLNICIN